jgi:hypothetical protein
MLKGFYLITQVAKNGQFPFQLKQVHVLFFWMRHFSGQEKIWIHSKMGG